MKTVRTIGLVLLILTAVYGGLTGQFALLFALIGIGIIIAIYDLVDAVEKLAKPKTESKTEINPINSWSSLIP